MRKWISFIFFALIIGFGFWILRHQAKLEIGMIGQFFIAVLMWFSMLFAVGDVQRLFALIKKDDKNESELCLIIALKWKMFLALLASFFTIFFLKDSSLDIKLIFLIFIILIGGIYYLVIKHWKVIILILDFPTERVARFPKEYMILASIMITLLLSVGGASFFAYIKIFP